MKNNELIRVVVAETSVIIRSGIATVLKRLPHVKVQSVEITSIEALSDCLRTQCPDLLIINPAFGNYFDVVQFKEEMADAKVQVIALTSSFVDTAVLAKYDTFISVFDDLETIAAKIDKLQQADSVDEDETENQEVLSSREKEIVICVVKGMTNKEIAEKLFLSIHTVITHRRNISRKLQIHSAAGLTIYAIVNKLVTLNEVKAL